MTTLFVELAFLISVCVCVSFLISFSLCVCVCVLLLREAAEKVQNKRQLKYK